MKFRFLSDTAIMRAPEGGGGSGGGTDDKGTDNPDNKTGADNGDGKITLTAEELQAQIAKAVAEATAKETQGLKNKNTELLGKLKELQEQANKGQRITDEEYAKFREIQERIERDELLKLMAEGKSEEALNIATRKVKADMEAKLAAETQEKARLTAEAQEARRQLETTQITIAVTQASATAVKSEYTGLVDTLIKGKLKYVDGKVQVLDDAGGIAMKGDKPMTVSDLIESLRPNYPDLFKTSSGGGSGGSQKPGTASGGGTPTQEDMAGMSMEAFIKARKGGKTA